MLSVDTDKRLWKIVHRRCGEWSATTYIWAAAEWDEATVTKQLRAAQDAYITALQTARKETPPPHGYGPFTQPKFEQYPDKTVAEVRAEHEVKRAEYKAWEEEQRRTKRKFEDFLAEHGFLRLWEAEDNESELDWGHRHGVPINYGESEPDGFPTPAKALGQEDDDDY